MVIIIEEGLHCANFIHFCLPSPGLFVEIMTFLGTNILRMRIVEVLFRIGLECTFRIFLVLLLFPNFLFLKVLT
jgi:hypothetical protein